MSFPTITIKFVPPSDPQDTLVKISIDWIDMLNNKEYHMRSVCPFDDVFEILPYVAKEVVQRTLESIRDEYSK